MDAKEIVESLRAAEREFAALPNKPDSAACLRIAQLWAIPLICKLDRLNFELHGSKFRTLAEYGKARDSKCPPGSERAIPGLPCVYVDRVGWVPCYAFLPADPVITQTVQYAQEIFSASYPPQNLRPSRTRFTDAAGHLVTILEGLAGGGARNGDDGANKPKAKRVAVPLDMPGLPASLSDMVAFIKTKPLWIAEKCAVKTAVGQHPSEILRDAKRHGPYIKRWIYYPNKKAGRTIGVHKPVTN